MGLLLLLLGLAFCLAALFAGGCVALVCGWVCRVTLDAAGRDG